MTLVRRTLSLPTLGVGAGVLTSMMLLLGCGARGGLTDELGDAGEACPLPSAVRGVVGTVDGHGCALEGRSPDGRSHRMDCRVVEGPRPRSFAGCRWSTDGETVCECDAPNWANTCPNGVPICVSWNRPFDFASDVVFER